MPTETPVLEVRELFKQFRPSPFKPPVRALEGLSLRVDPGECYGFFGLNGVGKSTANKIWMGFLLPGSGHVRIFGESPQEPEVRHRIGYLPESLHIDLNLTGIEVLRYASLLSGGTHLSDTDLQCELDSVGLGAEGNRAVRDYSKGMRQRLAVAQATIHEPQLLVLDEPFGGLDPEGRSLLKDRIRETKARGGSVILTTHQLREADDVCDRVGVIVAGRLTHEGALEEMRSRQDWKGLELWFLECVAHAESGTADPAGRAPADVIDVSRDVVPVSAGAGIADIQRHHGTCSADGSEGSVSPETADRKGSGHVPGLIQNAVSIARFTLLQSMRDRTYILTSLILVAAILSVGMLRSAEAGMRVKLIIDFGLMTLDACALFVLMVISQTRLAPDLTPPSVHFPLSRCVSRSALLLGKWMAALALVVLNVGLLAAFLQVVILLDGGGLAPNFLKGAFVGLCKVSMFTSVLVFFHVLFSPMVSTGCGFMAWVACANLPILKQTATTTGIWFFDKIFDVVLNAVPDLSHFDLNFVVVHEHSIPLWFVGAIAVYSLAWSYGSLSISSYFLEGKDL